MNLFGYDPKHKDRLPYYDTFPLIFPLEPAKGGFIGLNFHYLKPGARVAFLRSLANTTTDKKFDKKTRYNINWRNNAFMKKNSKTLFVQSCENIIFEHNSRRNGDCNISTCCKI